MIKKLTFCALACFALLCAGKASASQIQGEQKGYLVFYEVVADEEEALPLFVPAKHERRLAQNEFLAENSADYYTRFKENIKYRTGLNFGADISFTGQRAAPSGKKTAVQAVYYPYAVWNLFKDTKIGSGKIDFNYNLVRYWGANGAELGDRVAVANPINDYPNNQDIFSQLTYTHVLPESMAWLSITLGQFPLYNFDGTTYDSNQQTGLMNYALSQNASASYPNASLGAYLSAAITDNLTFSGGYQSASNISGSRIKFKEAFGGEYTGFGSLNYSGANGQYGVMGYYQPSTDEQNGYSWGWSVNAEQNVYGKFSVFGRANGSTNDVMPIKDSFVLGFSYANPLDRNPLDAITFAAAYNRLNKGAFDSETIRTGETVMEAQWVFGVCNHLTITPDVQVYPEAGLNSAQKWVTVASLRGTLMF